MSIDTTPLASLDTDARRRAEYISRSTWGQKSPHITRIPMADLNSIYVFSNPLFRLDFYFVRFSLLGLERGEELLQSPLGTPSVLVYLFYIYLSMVSLTTIMFK